MKAFKGLHRYYEFTESRPKVICGRFFSSVHLGIEELTQDLINQIEINEQLCYRQEIHNARRRGSSSVYTPNIWLAVASKIRRGVADFDQRFYDDIEDEYRIIKENHRYLWPDNFWRNAAKGKRTKQKATKRKDKIVAKITKAFTYIIARHIDNTIANMTVDDVAKHIGVKRVTLYKKPHYRRVINMIAASKKDDFQPGLVHLREDGASIVDGVVFDQQDD
ncbi:hypothetical protein K2Y11_22455 [bacterium]|nr:hypothetical protein [bacterium]